MGVPYWDIYSNGSYELLEANGFTKTSEQVGMYLTLTGPYEKAGTLTIKKVVDMETALLWEELFKQAFNYRISHKLLLPPYENIDYFIAWHQGNPAGTVVLHDTGSIIGIHSMGIIPSMRRKGLAAQLMNNVLNLAYKNGYEYATLQASEAARGLYLKLGFEEQFVMKNYILSH